MRKTIRVVAAIIIDEDRVFATQRGYGDWKDYWEFPGGKIEPGETPEAALHREILEELDTEITVGEKFTTIEYDYPEFHLSMDCFLAVSGQYKCTDFRHKVHSFLHDSFSVFEAVAVAGHIDDFAAMNEPVQDGRGDRRVA